MKDIQKIKEFFSQPMKESLTGGYPHTKTSGENFEKITITEPIDDATKNKMIQNFRAAGWDAKPNNGGGITAIKKAMMEAKEETAIDMAKKQLDALGIKYEMSGNKFKPFKVIYKPYNEDLDALYDQEYELTRIYQQDKGKENWEKLSQIREKGKRLEEFEDIIDLFNLGSAVKSSMGEAKFMSGMLSGKDFINAKLQNYPKAVAKVNQLINMIGEDKFTIEMAEWIFDFFNNASYESPMTKLRLENKAKEEDKVDTITMDVPLFIRMLEYSREDAAEDMDLHDITEKAISLNKEKDILSMEDYDAIVGSAEEIEEGFYGKGDKRRGLQNQSKLSSAEYQMAKKLKSFKASDWKWNADEDLYTKVNEASSFAQQAAIAISKKKSGNYDKEGKRIKETSNPQSGKAAPYGSGYKPLEERIFEALDSINEELCPAGKAYRKRRMAAGEKSSAYLSGRAVKVCKGQMSGKKKK